LEVERGGFEYYYLGACSMILLKESPWLGLGRGSVMVCCGMVTSLDIDMDMPIPLPPFILMD
jgi:hypothetical protein